jgi:hypothetical protein
VRVLACRGAIADPVHRPGIVLGVQRRPLGSRSAWCHGPVPAGLPGALAIGVAGTLAVVLWRWRWFRAVTAGAAVCMLAWSLSGLMAAGVAST